jgi:nucleotide-binding universal stress UspA family protein
VDAVHVREPDQAPPESTAEAAGEPLRLLDGAVVETLAALATAADAVVLVVGSTGRPDEPAVLGHVAVELLHRCDTPILVVPPRARVADRIRRVLIAMKGTYGNALTLTRAVDLAAGAAIELVVVHVDSASTIPSFSDQPQHEADAYAAEFLARYVPGAPSAQLELRIGVPAEEILRVTEETRPDAIAIGHRQASPLAGSDVTRHIIERIDVPVFVVVTR